MGRVLPILFNTEMVWAILDGRKTVTRRVIKHNVDAVLNSPYHKGHPETPDKTIIEKLCMPPYQPGYVLYVRETWSYGQDDTCIGASDGECPNKSCEEADGPCFKYRYFYKANESLPVGEKWHQSIHMPKEAARIWLKVTDVRVERLKDITDESAIKEGFEGVPCTCCQGYPCTDCMNTGWIEPPGVGFMYTWDSTIKKSDLGRYGWDANPWVWVIEFERCEKPETARKDWN